MTPAWTAATTSSPGWRRARVLTASDARTMKLDQLSPPGAIGALGVAVPVGDAERLDDVVP